MLTRSLIVFDYSVTEVVNVWRYVWVLYIVLYDLSIWYGIWGITRESSTDKSRFCNIFFLTEKKNNEVDYQFSIVKRIHITKIHRFVLNVNIGIIVLVDDCDKLFRHNKHCRALLMASWRHFVSLSVRKKNAFRICVFDGQSTGPNLLGHMA